MNILVYVEQLAGKLSKTALSTITAARQIKALHGYSRLSAIVLGGDEVSTAAEQIAEYGVDEVFAVKDSRLSPYVASNFASVVYEVAEKVSAAAVVGLSSSQGKDFFPRLAQKLGAGQASECIAILPDGKLKRPMYAGNLIATVQLRSDRKVITIRATAFEPAVKSGSKAPVVEHSSSFDIDSKVEFISFESSKSERPELSEAEVVVSGGRALKSAENFQSVLFPLADVLNAALGASRAAVDAGYAPNDWQVGQTGKVVAPKLYIAIGISGAIQHLAGMKDSKVIVSINKDPECPLMEAADYALQGDLFQIVPELTEAIKNLKAG